jgi:transposase
MQGEEKMGKKSLERRVYTEGFKPEAAALAGKKEKPVSQIAKDLGINDGVLYRRIQQARGAENGIKALPGHGRSRDGELARLRKEVKLLREANEILKKAAAVFAQEEPR